MTEEDKELIGRYMNWEIDQGVWRLAPNGDIDTADFDLNDAGLCVQEIQKRGDWQKCCATGFVIYFEGERPSHVFPENYIAWLFNADNFFKAFVEWRKGK